jgi:hypothetical protein
MIKRPNSISEILNKEIICNTAKYSKRKGTQQIQTEVSERVMKKEINNHPSRSN